jgi:hypothetical protein
MTDPNTELNRLKLRWEPILRRPDWYLTIIPEIESFKRQRLATQTEPIRDAVKTLLYDFFEGHLKRHTIALGRGGGMDVERKPIDTVVIHHTSNPPGLSPERLSAIELIRLYAPYFLNPLSKQDEHLRGRPIYSGHVRRGQQVFWPYHWIVRNDGSAYRLLHDSEIGWHAGSWDVNCRSIAIVLDNDYEWGPPSEGELRGIARIIWNHYHFVSRSRILGHCEVTMKTVCPSRLFLDGGGHYGWKRQILSALGERAAA